MLQGRLFAYHDAQLYRVGTNHQHLPVNRPRCPFHNQQRDGAMAMDNGGALASYEPVNANGTDARGFGHGDAGWPVEGVAGRYDPRGQDDDFTQAGNLFRLLDADAQDRLTTNIANAMRGVPRDIRERQVGHFRKADPRYGAEVARKLAVTG
jgi:catalase